jgi:hypothetical protein
MRDPTANTIAAAEAKRVSDAVEFAKEHLYWTLVSDRRWADSRWSGRSPEDERKQEFRYSMEGVRKIINEVPDPGLRKYLATWLEEAFPHPPTQKKGELREQWLERALPLPRPRKKGELREQMNALRNQWIAEMVALTCRDGTFLPTRNKDPKVTRPRRESGCSIVAEALRQLGKGMDETSVTEIWIRHKQTYRHLLPR